MAHGTRGTTLTWRQLVVADLVVLAAFALVLNRPFLPAWLLPEHSTNPWVAALARPPSHGSEALWSGGPGANQLLEYRARFVAIPPPEGKPMLVVGDSLIAGWPWTADMVCVPGPDLRKLLRAFKQRSRKFHYEQIVVWTGTAALVHGKDVHTYVRDLQTVVALARERGDAVFVLGPMPATYGDEHSWAARMPVRDTRALATGVTGQIAAMLAGTPVLDIAGWRRAIVEAGNLDALTVDGCHLNADGFRHLEPELRRLGVQLGSVEVIRAESAAPPRPARAASTDSRT